MVEGSSCIPITFRQDVAESYQRRADDKGNAKFGERPLKMGVLWRDGMVGLHPPVLRGLKVVVEALKKAGHKVRTNRLVKDLRLTNNRSLTGNHHRTKRQQIFTQVTHTLNL